MPEPTPFLQKSATGFLLVAVGVALALAAWSLPVNLKSVSPALLTAAGRGTPTLAEFGRELVASEKSGPAALVLDAARAVGDPRAGVLELTLGTLTQRQAESAVWGGWDAALEPVFNLRDPVPASPGGGGVLTFFLPERARERLRAHLGASRSPGVRILLALRELTATGRFVPAAQPGGQPLDALLLLTALLYQAERLSPPLQRELRLLADTALETRTLGELEPALLDLLSLAQRLNWVQLAELLRRTNGTKTLGEFAQLARAAPGELPLIYAAALFSDSADGVASYLLQFGKNGLADLRLALTHGQGAVRLLIARQVPVNRATAPTLSAAASLGLLQPRLGIFLKYLGYLAGAFLVFRGIERGLFPARTGAGRELPRARSGVLALLFAGLLVVATEPFLLKAAPPSEFRFRLSIPVLALSAPAPVSEKTQPIAHMDTAKIITIAVFASLQVAMYFICLVKIRDISRLPLPALVRLKLLENEENLFDGGLYLGIAGTASALVLQVLRVIEGDLLAAYSSNLFGIVCVALVKIRHVRQAKRELILAAQTETIATP